VHHIVESGGHMWWRWWRRRWDIWRSHAHLGHKVSRLGLAVLLGQPDGQRLRSALGYYVVQRRYGLLGLLALVVPIWFDLSIESTPHRWQMSDVQKKNERKERKTLDEPGVNIKWDQIKLGQEDTPPLKCSASRIVLHTMLNNNENI